MKHTQKSEKEEYNIYSKYEYNEYNKHEYNMSGCDNEHSNQLRKASQLRHDVIKSISCSDVNALIIV